MKPDKSTINSIYSSVATLAATITVLGLILTSVFSLLRLEAWKACLFITASFLIGMPFGIGAGETLRILKIRVKSSLLRVVLNIVVILAFVAAHAYLYALLSRLKPSMSGPFKTIEDMFSHAGFLTAAFATSRMFEKLPVAENFGSEDSLA